MPSEKLQLSFFFLFFGLIAALTFFVFMPFLSVLVIAAILAVLLYPLYTHAQSLVRGYGSIASILVILIALVFIAVPISILGVQIFNESKALYTTLQEGRVDYVKTITTFIEQPIRTFLPEFRIDTHEYLAKIFNWISGNLGPFVTGTAQVFLKILLVIIALFFFLRDGAHFAKSFMRLSPLDDVYDREIIKRVSATVNSVMRGTLFIAIIQGFLVGVGLLIFGVPNATLWGSIAALSALIPGIGTGLIVIPSVIYLAIIEHSGAAIGLAIWGIAIVGLVDNFLLPYFYSRGVKIHPVFVLFSVLGGLIVFGPIGFLFGPLVLSLFMSLLYVYRVLVLKESADSAQE